MNNIDRTVIQSITALVVFLSLENETLESWIANLFPSSNIVLPASAFVLLYRVLHLTYEKILWAYFNKEQSISGEWAYRVNNETIRKSRYGVFCIQQDLNGVQIKNGNVWFYGKPPNSSNLRGTWFSTASSVVGNELHFIFDMKTLARKDVAGIGERVVGTVILDLQREKGRPVELYGKFYDHLERTGNRGSFIAQRITGKTRKERKEEAFSLFGSDEPN